MQNCFTIRVYAIIINSRKEVLLSHEEINGFAFTKFPGGGLEFGEGTIEAIVREVQEETGITVQVKQHLYTTDFFQQNRFNLQEQVLSIYYLAEADEEQLKKISTDLHEHPFRHTNNKIRFEWRPLQSLQSNDFTFETEKAALKKLHKLHKHPTAD